MKILAIETSCDETAISVVKASGNLTDGNLKFKILKNNIASQIKIHRPFGGVVPNLAKREHLKNLPILLKKTAASEVRLMKSVDAIAVTVGPGLEPALWTGIEFAKALAKKYKKPLIGTSHLEGHLFSFLLEKKTVSGKNIFPAIALIVSGGHTILLKLDSLAKVKKLGETVDDAAGEAFDKVAKMLALPYPGGPEVERLAKIGDPHAMNFPRPMLNQKNYSFSFSGLKTSVLYFLRGNPQSDKADVCASFQNSVMDVLTKKTLRAAKEFQARTILISGGVASNKTLRAAMKKVAKENNLAFFAPTGKLNTDNAAMIAVAAYIKFLEKKNRRISANAGINF